MKALLYEYELDIELLLSYLVEGEGFDLQVASSQEELLASCVKDSPDLMILGNCPPGISQEDLISYLHEQGFLDHGYLLVLSTDPGICEFIPSMSQHNIECIRTPIVPSQLRAALRRIQASLRPALGLNQASSG